MAITIGATWKFFKPKLVENIPGIHRSYRNFLGIGKDISYDKWVIPAGKYDISYKVGYNTIAKRSSRTVASCLESTPVIFGIRLPNFTTYSKKCKVGREGVFYRE
ncbi:hypothetical protein IJD34_05675 [bacterium]|nr:hypothetical protein [bacterium]